jgi:hypothetical protein
VEKRILITEDKKQAEKTKRAPGIHAQNKLHRKQVANHLLSTVAKMSAIASSDKKNNNRQHPKNQSLF